MRKKHKRLDAIIENEFNRSNRGSDERRKSVEVEDGVRRSSRVRRAPVILDSSPLPSRKRRKVGGENGDGSIRALDEREKDKTWDSEDELGSLRSRLRSRVKEVGLGRGKRKADSPRAKRRLYEDSDEGKTEEKSGGDRLREGEVADEEKSTVGKTRRAGRIRDSCDIGVEMLDGEVGSSASESDDEASLSSRETDDEGDVEMSVGSSVQEDDEEHGDCQLRIADDADRTVGPRVILKLSVQKEEEAKQEDSAEVAMVQHLLKDGQENVNRHVLLEQEKKHPEDKNAEKQSNQNSSAGLGHRYSKEGRRCGLCGTSANGKPPKKLIQDAAESDHEAYSGSSGAEEPNYDRWDGFVDEPGWLGRLLGPVNDRYGIAGIWVHQQCAVWSPEVYFAGLGCLKNIRAALSRGRALKCTICGRRGATIGCRVDRCPRTYHLPCARASGCVFDHKKFLIACTDHRYLFQPRGPLYTQHIKKLKAKKMKLEVRKLSIDAWRKDIEAEEKWMEKCGEDEEFLRRETKRLQRDMLRIAPVYIGGPQAEGEKLFEGWESVGGLQDVIRCMKEVVILPLLYPEFFDNLGLTPPRGVLLHGYPGTGKTLVVRALIGSSARASRRIAYFARKGADCLGKYVGDAERQLRLLFHVAEKSQPSIIFFDEIDGLAPVRTRNQDQTHSSVVSTLLALMDGLKSRGSVIVIGATNRPDAVDPALRRPGRFDREIYFPLPSIKDRAAILTLHTKRWLKPVTGHLLQWIATRTVGFAGADLRALCAQAAVIALKRHCPLQEILSAAAEDSLKGKLPELPNFVVEERDWMEALLGCPPPCSRREAGMSANEIVGSPLQTCLVSCLLPPLCNLLISLFLDDRIWLPPPLVKAVCIIKDTIVSAAMQKNLCAQEWCHCARDLVQESDIANCIARRLSDSGVLVTDAAACWCHLPNNVCGDDVERSDTYSDENPCSVKLINLSHGSLNRSGYRVLIAGSQSSGQNHLASCILQGFVGYVEIQKLDFATISLEGRGDMVQGITGVLMKCSSLKRCTLFMPRMDLWAIECHHEVFQDDKNQEHDAVGVLNGVMCNPNTETADSEEPGNEENSASHMWNSFVEQVESICVSRSLIILATSEVPCAELPERIRHFFGSDTLPSEISISSDYAIPRITLQLDGRLNQDMVLRSASAELSRDLVLQFVQFVRQRSHAHSNPNVMPKGHDRGEQDCQYLKTSQGTTEGPEAKIQRPDVPSEKVPVLSNTRSMRTKSNLALAISTFGYQILRYPHFSEVCWVTSKLKEGPSADIRGPWKGWPFNSCIVRPDDSLVKDAIARSPGFVKGKDKLYRVRGLVAVSLSAYRGIYTSLSEVSSEVRKVLESLVEQINMKIQAGKDRYQFISLLSQVAYLEDVVNAWKYGLRSLEMDNRTTATVKPIGDGSLDGHTTCANARSQLNGESNPLNNGFLELKPEEKVLQGFVVETKEPLDLNKVCADDVDDNSGDLMNIEKIPEGKAASVVSNLMQENGNSEKEPQIVEGEKYLVVHRDHTLHADVPDPMSFDESGSITSNEKRETASKPFVYDHVNDLTAGAGTESMNQSNGFIDAVSPVNRDCDARSLGKVNSGGLCSSCKVHDQSTSLTMVVDVEDGKGGGDTQGNLLSEKTSSLSVEAGTFCSYSCCRECLYALQRQVHKIVFEEWESAGGCLNVGDAHDLVATLSTRFSSVLVKLYSDRGFLSSIDKESVCGRQSKLFESQEMKKCQCRTAEETLFTSMECICHSEKGDHSEVNPSPSNQLELNSEFVYKDGVLVPADMGKDASFHCKYDRLCLCSFVELIASNKPSIR
ncbi:hypothetical protein Droror1_Dr00015124 [Drosera rotundifolia]